MEDNRRRILTYRNYFRDFISGLKPGVVRKIQFVLDMLITGNRVSSKFVKNLREGIFEIRAEYEGNIFRVFFIFDEGNIVVLFNGFQKKTQKTPESEIKKAIAIKKEYITWKSTVSNSQK